MARVVSTRCNRLRVNLTYYIKPTFSKRMYIDHHFFFFVNFFCGPLATSNQHNSTELNYLFNSITDDADKTHQTNAKRPWETFWIKFNANTTNIVWVMPVSLRSCFGPSSMRKTFWNNTPSVVGTYATNVPQPSIANMWRKLCFFSSVASKFENIYQCIFHVPVQEVM